MGIKTFSIAAALLLSASPAFAAHYLEVKLTTSAVVAIPFDDGSGIPIDQYYNFKTTADVVLNMADYPAGSDFFSSSAQWDIIDASYDASRFNLFLEDAFDSSVYFEGHVPLSGLDLSHNFSRTFHNVGSYYATYLIDARYDVTGSVSGPIGNVLVRTFDSDAGLPSSVTGNQSFRALAAPEPASWMMLLGGFGLVGGAMRRRKTVIHYA